MFTNLFCLGGYIMIHHISLAVRNPLHVAEVVAELWQGSSEGPKGRAIPFPYHPGCYMALALDVNGTAIEFLPKGTVLEPGSAAQPVQFSAPAPHAISYTATHVNLAVPISEAKIYEIADREGWRAIRCNRGGFFELIEFWIENEVLLELLPPNLMEQYRLTMRPENVQAVLDAVPA
jgi:hypothetical protein